jgi:hypothetical protein
MTNVQITEQNLVEELRSTFPEIEALYQEETNSWGNKNPGKYNIFAFVFKPILKQELSKTGNEDFLRRFCLFIERVCISGDKEAINIIWLKIFKLLLADSETVKRIWPLLGTATKSNIKDAASRWHLIGNLPILARPHAALFLFTPHRPA